MVDFASATPTYSTQRRYEQIEEFDDFVAVKETFLNDTSMGLAEKTLKSEAYTGVVDFTKGGKVVATVRIDTKDEDGYANLMAAINTEIFAEDAYGAGAKAAENPDKRNWKLNFIGLPASGDKFKLLVDESYAELSGYHEPATLTIVETWADTVTVLSNDPKA